MLSKLLKKKKADSGKNPYRFIALDTTTELEDLILPYAKVLYNETVMGKNWKGTDVKELPNGSGYHYLRTAFFNIIKEIGLTLILLPSI